MIHHDYTIMDYGVAVETFASKLKSIHFIITYFSKPQIHPILIPLSCPSSV